MPMYKVSEIAKLLNISRAIAYDKVNSIDKKYIHKIDGIKHVDSKGLEIIKSGTTPVDDSKESIQSVRQDHISTLILQIEQLSKELEIRDRQLEAKDMQIQNKDELLKEFQILLKGEQDKVLMLEGSLQEEKSKSLWDRIFKK